MLGPSSTTPIRPTWLCSNATVKICAQPTYTGVLTSGSTALSGVTYTWRVVDDGRLSASGVQLDVTLTHGDLSKLSVLVTAPKAARRRRRLSLDVAPPRETRARLPARHDCRRRYGPVDGRVQRAAAREQSMPWKRSSKVRAATARASGGCPRRSSSSRVVYGDKSSGAADIDAARKAVARITYATRIGALILREADGVLPAGGTPFCRR